MAAIEEMEIPLQLVPYLNTSIKGTGVSAKLASPHKIRELVSNFFWIWYEDNKYKVAFKLSLFTKLIKVNVYVYQLEDLFISLFGPKDGVSS